MNLLKNMIENGGERVFIDLNKEIDFSSFNVHEKNHYKRYEFISGFIAKIDRSKSLIVGDFACGSGYGTCMMSGSSKKVTGIDINEKIIEFNQTHYKRFENVEFISTNIFSLSYHHDFDLIASFETIEHFDENDILTIMQKFYDALTPEGYFVFSVPYMEEESEEALKKGFHKTYFIDEKKIARWMGNTHFRVEQLFYQSYEHPDLIDKLDHKDFMVCIAKKN